MSGGKGGTQTTEVRLPKAIERASAENLALADEIGRIGFVPYQGPTVAGLSSGQQAAMANTNAGAGAFGLAQANIPAPPVSTAQMQQPVQPTPSPLPAQQPASSGGDKGAALANRNDLTPTTRAILGSKGGSTPAPSGPVEPHQLTPPTQQLTGEMGAGYSPYGMFTQGVNAIAPGQLGAIQGYMINPQTGGLPSRPTPRVRISSRSRGKK
jgi:hypothetical protein